MRTTKESNRVAAAAGQAAVAIVYKAITTGATKKDAIQKVVNETGLTARAIKDASYIMEHSTEMMLHEWKNGNITRTAAYNICFELTKEKQDQVLQQYLNGDISVGNAKRRRTNKHIGIKRAIHDIMRELFNLNKLDLLNRTEAAIKLQQLNKLITILTTEDTNG